MYRRRRITVSILAVLTAGLLVLGVVLLTHAVQSIREDLANPAPAPTTAEPTAPGPEGDAGSGACPPDVISVAAATDEPEYESGQKPELTIEVTNGQSADCVIDVGEAQQEFIIERDGDTVWSSRYCATTGEDDDAASNPMVFAAESSKKASLTWPRVPVDDGCKQTGDAFPAGDYELIVALGETTSEPVPFTLLPDPEAEASEKAKKEKADAEEPEPEATDSE